MKINLYDLMNSYDSTALKLDDQTASAQRISALTLEKIQQPRRKRPARLLLIAAVVVLCLGTTALATATGVFDSLKQAIHTDLSYRFSGTPDDTGFEFVTEVSSGTGLDVAIDNSEIVLVTNDGGAWSLEQGQAVDISISILTGGVRCENDPGYGIHASYVRVDEDGTMLDTGDVCICQIFDATSATFDVPETGLYYFYFLHSSSDPYILDSFVVTP